MARELDITALRAKANLDITSNLFSKDELKQLFIFNYKTTFGNGEIMALNNNDGYQCFRNAAFYLLLRFQKKIWDLIDTLPVAINFNSLGSDDDKNKYLVIQTLIELMDNTIINRLISVGTIEKKRTTFIDNRLDIFITTPSNKYQLLGLLNKYSQAYFTEIASILGMSVADYKAIAGTAGGQSSNVINFIVTNIFNTSNISLDIKPTLLDISNNIVSETNNYLLYKINTVLAKDIYSDLNTYKLLTNSTGETYKLVGILYDCGTHQITSVCFGSQCLDIKADGYVTHNFIDDNLFIKNKSLNPNDYELGKVTGLNYSCRTASNLKVDYVLYEKVQAVTELNTEINSYLTTNNLTVTDLVIHGGGNNDEYYKLKYLKYKAKYLKLKNI